jgi:heme oxygenase
MGNKCTEMYRFEQLIKKRKKKKVYKEKRTKKEINKK